MSKYTTILFDLDGTIIDSGEGVTNSVSYALEKMGIEVKEKSVLKCFIGPPLVYSFQHFYGLDEEATMKAIFFYREYYTEKGINEGYIYDGIEDLLKTLKSANKRIILATSKPELYAKRILDNANLSKYFDFIAGATLDEKTRHTKEQVLEYAIKEANIDTSSSIMVGDRFYDVEGARAYGMPCIGVTYGYGTKEELEEHKALYIAETPKDVAEIVL
jgi:phosphoglycolate phosphatase